MSEKPRLFLSHIHEEAALAGALKKWTEETFPGQCKVFVSSDKNDIPVGSKWFNKIGDALAEARVLVVLCSPASLERPWINFETGYVYARDVPIFPVCHSGLKIGALPRTLGEFESVEMDEANFCVDYLKGVAEHIGAPGVPPIDGKKMMAALNKALPKHDRKKAGRAQSVDKDSGETLEPECEKILELAWRLDTFTISDVASRLGKHWDKPGQKKEVMYFMEVLFDEKLIKGTGLNILVDNAWTEWTEFELSSKGRKRMYVRRRRKSNAEHS